MLASKDFCSSSGAKAAGETGVSVSFVEPVGEDEIIPSAADIVFQQEVNDEQTHSIKYRTMGWKKCAALLLGEQIGFAIAALPWSFSVLGWLGGLLTMFISWALFWLTSHTLWLYVMRHPNCKDIIDVGCHLFGKSKVAREVTAAMFVANSVLFLGFGILTGAKIFNTVTDHSQCTVVFAGITTVIGIIASIPRTLDHISLMSIPSASFMVLSLLLFMIFAGIEDHPSAGSEGAYPIQGPVGTNLLPKEGSTWIAISNAAISINFLFVPHALFPSFISEMKRPRDFPKSLAALAIFSLVLFALPAVVGFAYLGQYATAPAYGSLQPRYKKISSAFAMVSVIVLGVMCSNVTAKCVYKRILKDSPHQYSHTVTGWGVWAAIVALLWILGLVSAEVIPSMGDFFALLGAAFDSFFGFIFWAMAYYYTYKGRLFRTRGEIVLTIAHIIVLLVGLYQLGPGLYTSIEAIIDDYSGRVRPAFACADLSL